MFINSIICLNHIIQVQLLLYQSSYTILLISASNFKQKFESFKKKYMPKPTYMTLPIYSIATFNQYFYFSGGGGGKTGIPNQIFIYKYNVQREPFARISTGDKIVQNLLTVSEKKILFASANQKIKIYNIEEGGQKLQLMYEFQADFSHKNATLYSTCFSLQRSILCTAGQDMIIRFFHIDFNQVNHEKVFQHNLHTQPLKNVDNNEGNIFLSCDTSQIVLTNLQKKSIIKKIYQDQLKPQKSLFQSAYFINAKKNQLVICHYILRKAAYVTKQNTNGTLSTAQITKDQSCLTTYNRNLKALGIACGNGSTYLVKSTNLQQIGKDHNHGFVITGGTISRGGRFITGTPECSYHIQMIDQPLFNINIAFFVAILLTLIFIFLLGSTNSSIFGSAISEFDL